METRTIGDLEVTMVGLSCSNFGSGVDDEAIDSLVGTALDSDINFFDTADVYGDGASEQLLGKALSNRRDSVVIATKFGTPWGGSGGGASPAYIRQAIESSLGRLGTDWVDLYQLHRADNSVPLEETLGVLGELVDEGKVREIGCSSFSPAQLREAAAATRPGRAGLTSVQSEYSILHKDPEEDGLLATCAALGVGLLPRFPFAKGRLTGKHPDGDAVDGLVGTVIEGLRLLAVEFGCSVLDLAFAFLLDRAGVPSVIAGAATAEQVRANAAAADFAGRGLGARIEQIATR